MICQDAVVATVLFLSVVAMQAYQFQEFCKLHTWVSRSQFVWVSFHVGQTLPTAFMSNSVGLLLHRGLFEDTGISFVWNKTYDMRWKNTKNCHAKINCRQSPNFFKTHRRKRFGFPRKSLINSSSCAPVVEPMFNNKKRRRLGTLTLVVKGLIYKSSYRLTAQTQWEGSALPSIRNQEDRRLD